MPGPPRSARFCCCLCLHGLAVSARETRSPRGLSRSPPTAGSRRSEEALDCTHEMRKAHGHAGPNLQMSLPAGNLPVAPSPSPQRGLGQSAAKAPARGGAASLDDRRDVRASPTSCFSSGRPGRLGADVRRFLRGTRSTIAASAGGLPQDRCGRGPHAWAWDGGVITSDHERCQACWVALSTNEPCYSGANSSVLCKACFEPSSPSRSHPASPSRKRTYAAVARSCLPDSTTRC